MTEKVNHWHWLKASRFTINLYLKVSADKCSIFSCSHTIKKLHVIIGQLKQSRFYLTLNSPIIKWHLTLTTLSLSAIPFGHLQGCYVIRDTEIENQQVTNFTFLNLVKCNLTGRYKSRIGSTWIPHLGLTKKNDKTSRNHPSPNL